MKKALLSIILGGYVYIIAQVVFFLRFNRFNDDFAVTDLSIYLVGLISVYLHLTLLDFVTKKDIIWTNLLFILASSLSLPLIFFSGLVFGFLGIFIIGLIPFVAYGFIVFTFFREKSEIKS
jgi:hypothetical protein